VIDHVNPLDSSREGGPIAEIADRDVDAGDARRVMRPDRVTLKRADLIAA